MADPNSESTFLPSSAVVSADAATAVGQPATITPSQWDRLRLILVPKLGPRTLALLLEKFDSPAAVLAASAAELQDVPGVGPKLAMAIVASHHSTAAENEWKTCQEAGVNLLFRGAENYPRNFNQMPDPPELVYCKGDLTEADTLGIAIVGSRHCTLYGQRQAEKLAYGLASAGMTVVSGLARGIDAAAHRGALKAKGRTIAVLGNGLGHIYPPEHAELSLDIRRAGALVSEYSFGQPPLPGLFPQRNRIISGLSLGTIVVEANRGSGALHTARHAAEQNRDVFALPGPVDSPASAGTNDLIRDGATLIRDVDDVLQALGPLIQPVRRGPTEDVHNPRELALSDQERQILNLVGLRATSIDEVLSAAGLEPSRVLATLTVLEMKRLVRRHPGNMVARYQ